jgi:type IV secretory pathway TrbD component
VTYELGSFVPAEPAYSERVHIFSETLRVMTKVPRLQPVYASINKPLTIGGADRRLFFVALVVGGATFTLFGSLLTGLVMFLALYLAARWVSARDPQLLRIVLRSATARPRYDSGTFDYVSVTRGNGS